MGEVRNGESWVYRRNRDLFATFSFGHNFVQSIPVPLFFLMVGALLVAVVFLFRDKLFIREESPPEVPEELAAWTLRRDSLWVRFYHWYFGYYPRDICSYIPMSCLLILGVVMISVGAVLILLPLLSWLLWILYGLYCLIVEFPTIVVWLFTKFPALVVSVAVFIGTTPLAYKAVAVLVALMLGIIFFRSRTWQLLRLWVRAKKKRFCPRIRVV